MKMQRTWKKDFEGYIFFKHSTYQKLCVLNVLYKKEGAKLTLIKRTPRPAL